MEKILLTRAGYEKLMRELELLSRVERPRLVQEILEAIPEGRGESDADLKEILAQRQWLEGRIKQLQQILANAEVLVGSNLPPDKVRFNSLVRLVNLSTGQEKCYKLVGPLEADATKGHLSMFSPLGQALMGRGLGDRVELETPAGWRSYRILEIHMDQV